MTRAADRAYTGPRNKNAVINGDFRVWQRGSPFTSIGGGSYSADTWKYHKSGAVVHDILRSTDVPTVAQAGFRFTYSLHLDVTTADTSLVATDFSLIAHKMEGFNWAPLAQRDITLSFWVKATKTGTYCVSLGSGGNDRNYIVEYTVDASDTWEKKVINVPASPSAGTWYYDTNLGLELRFVLACGSSWQGTANSWDAQNAKYATSNQVNGTDSATNDFRITGVQLERGSEATEFEYRTIQDEFTQCMRYYQNPGYGATVTTIGWAASSVTSSHNLHTSHQFPVEMRANPTLTYVEWSSNGFPSTANFQTVTPSGFNCYKTSNSAPANPYWFGSYIASAEF